jgi:oligoendopeptidase F
MCTFHLSENISMTSATDQYCWDTTLLYPSAASPELERDFPEINGLIEEFRSRYRGQVAGLDAVAMAEAVHAFEALQGRIVRLASYAHLLFAADSEDDAVKSLSQRAAEFANLASRELLFFELEIMEIDDARFQQLAAAGELAGYRHFLESVRKFRPHTLPEREERLLKQKDLTGTEAFTRLFDELSASFRFRMELDGEEQDFTGDELLGLLHHHDAEVRQRAFTTFLDRHAEEGIVFGAVFNNMALDYGQELDLRAYSAPMEPTNIGNELPTPVVERLMTVTEDNYTLAREYFRLKADLMGIPRLKVSDIYAPLGDTGRRYTFSEAKDLVLDAYRAFEPEYASILEPFFSERRIDSLPRPGKGGGAFCMGISPSLPPYVLLNFTGTLRDVATLAHELGHGLHFVLAQKQSMLNYHPPLPLAETASVFGEMLLARMLLEREDDPVVKRELLCAKIEDIIATTFRQNVLTRFEERLHRERRQGLLTSDRLGDLWWEENAKLYGDTVEMLPSYRWGWSYISHFIHARFYCYSYVFAELLVLSLYRQYGIRGKAFIPLYEGILASGGSQSPAATLQPAGIDLNDPGFWQQGYDLLGELLAELREVLKECGDA